jgi:hypothetical protein
VLGQYLALKMAERKGFILVTKFQENWIIELLLISSIFLILRPPWALGLLLGDLKLSSL